jgi:Protein of unknown function (DUF2796)
MKLPAGLIALCGLAFPGALPAQAPHEHGVASLDVRVEGDRLDLRLRAPLESMAGLEKPPRTERQRLAVRKMAATLHDPQALFTPTAAAGCTAGEVVLRSDSLVPELLSRSPAADTVAASGTASAARKPASAAHPDLEAQVTFRCAKPQALTGLQVRLFEAFPALREIGAAIATPRGDSGVRLSPSRTSLTW